MSERSPMQNTDMEVCSLGTLGVYEETTRCSALGGGHREFRVGAAVRGSRGTVNRSVQTRRLWAAVNFLLGIVEIKPIQVKNDHGLQLLSSKTKVYANFQNFSATNSVSNLRASQIRFSTDVTVNTEKSFKTKSECHVKLVRFKIVFKSSRDCSN